MCAVSAVKQLSSVEVDEVSRENDLWACGRAQSVHCVTNKFTRLVGCTRSLTHFVTQSRLWRKTLVHSDFLQPGTELKLK